ncbi:MAG: DUF411 domain-containing protein, partial [Sphingopyxis sp.]
CHRGPGADAACREALRDKTRDIRGIAVPGMPRGSRGMEMADGSTDAFAVMAFADGGKVSQFRA